MGTAKPVQSALALQAGLRHLLALMTQLNPTHFTILLAGPVSATPRLLGQISNTRVIAADGGIAHAATLGVEPELWVGDFDSTEPSDLKSYDHIPRQAHPSAKAVTDGDLSIRQAIARGAQRFTLVGAFGGRIDHTFGIMSQAVALAQQGYEVSLSNGDMEGVPLTPEPRQFDYSDGTTFSVLAFSDLEGLSLEGAVWPLDAITMPFGDSLTLSNQVKGELIATLTKGSALLVAHLTAVD